MVLNHKYRLDRVLGSGGMATVYAATHRNGKEVALKLLHPDLASLESVRSRFLREGYVANFVKHPGAVSVLDDDVTDDGWAFLVMELLEGVTLQELWEAREAHIHPACVCAVTLQLLDVLEAAHVRGIVHRDVKPANLFLLPTGELKVLDFGIACMRLVGQRTTNAGAVLGTPAYMAPEQATGDASHIDARTDLFAVGAVAFALLVGETVHSAESTLDTLTQAATSHARPLAPLALGVPPTIAKVFERALSFDRDARWSSAREMRAALAVAARDAYGEVPGRAAIREALARRMHVGSVWRETLAPRERRNASPASSRPDVSTIGAMSSGTDRPRPPRRPRGGAVQVAAISLALGAALAFLVIPRAGATAAASHAATPATERTSLVADPTPVPEPTPAVIAAPPATEPSAPLAPARAAARRAPRPASSSVARAGCAPPFTIDPVTHIKKWKLECF
jgi:serine/threonine-protein kinase